MSKYKIGIDLGGSHIAVAVVNINGNIIGEIAQRDIDLSDLSTEKTNEFPEVEIEITKIMVELIKIAVKNAGVDFKEIDFIGIGSPGSSSGETIKRTNKLGLKEFNIGKALRDKFSEINLDLKVKILVENDANCAGIGELIKGSLAKTKNSILLTFRNRNRCSNYFKW